MSDDRTFETLEVWQESRALRNEIRELVKEFPKEETYRLKDQLIRSTRSVTANIAEGYGRFHFRENLQFCRQARGSLFETIDHIIVCLDEGFLMEPACEEFKENIYGIIHKLNGYISYIQKNIEEEE